MRFADLIPLHSHRAREPHPPYPAELFDWLSEQCAVHDVAWDASCGEGLAAVALTTHFHDVYATDPSHAAIRHAIPHPDVQYRVEPVMECGLSDHTADLVALEDGVHRIDREAFHREAVRVAKPHGVVASWWFGPVRIDPAIDAIVDRLHDGLLAPFGRAEERAWARDYRAEAFPFAELAAPSLDVRESWTLPRLIAHLEAWPSLARCRKATGHDPLEAARRLLASHWGEPETPRDASRRLYLRAGRVH